MKKVIKIASVYVGLIIGAGFASGREVLEYFNFPSNGKFFGVLISALMFMAIAYIILAKASENKIKSFDLYIDSVAGRCSTAIKNFILIYMFCGLFVMFAGSGALVDRISPFSNLWGAIVMALICFGVICFDVRGIVALNMVLVPLMICGILYVSFYSVIFNDVSVFAESGNRTIMLSAVCYCAYNTVTAGSVLVPLAEGATDKEIKKAAILGGFVIGLLIMVVWCVQQINIDILWDSELPMLELSALCGKACKRIYTAVLFMAICTTAVSYGFGIMSHFADKIKSLGQRVLFAAVLCLSAVPFSLYGFSNLVAELYSLFGYLGMIWIIWIVIDRYK